MLPCGPRAAVPMGEPCPPAAWSPPAGLTAEEVAKARGRAHQLISLLDDDRLWRLSRLALSGGVLEDVAAQPAPLPAAPGLAAPGRALAPPPGAFAAGPAPADGAAAYCRRATAELGAPGAAPVHDAAAHGAAALPPGPALAGHYPAGQQAPARPLPPGLLSPSPVAHGPVAHVPVAETSAQPAVGLAPEAVSSEEKQLAVRQGTLAPGPDTNDSAAPPCTTLIVRNLSVSFADQEAARTWFDCLGFEGQYDFFLFFPGKTRRRTPESEPPDPPPSLGYFFVNFVSPSFAQKCSEELEGKMVEGAPLNVVVSRKQGMKDLIQHFRALGESGGRVAPWLGGARRAYQ